MYTHKLMTLIYSNLKGSTDANKMLLNTGNTKPIVFMTMPNYI